MSDFAPFWTVACQASLSRGFSRPEMRHLCRLYIYIYIYIYIYTHTHTYTAAAKSLQSCLTLCDPIYGSPPGSPVPGIFQARTRVGCHFLLQCMKVKRESEVAQSCPTLRDPMDRSLPGPSVHRIFQARVLEWGAIVFSYTHTHIYIHIHIPPVGEESACNTGDLGSIPGSGRSPGGYGNHSSILAWRIMDRGD